MNHLEIYRYTCKQLCMKTLKQKGRYLLGMTKKETMSLARKYCETIKRKGFNKQKN